jgi:ABC-type sugar transport system substrate-binding protein
VTSDDALALNAIALLSTAGPARPVIGLGASPDGIAALRRGLLTATIDLRPRNQGEEAVETLVAAKKRICPNGQNPPCPPRSGTVQPVAIIGPEGSVPKGAN